MIPDSAARKNATTTVWMATPPGSRPANTRMALNKSLAIPERSSNEAINTNIGTATSEYSVTKPYTRLVTSGSALPPNQPKVKTSATRPVMKASGSPVTSRAKIAPTIRIVPSAISITRSPRHRWPAGRACRAATAACG